MWKSLRHLNVLPLMGVMMAENEFVMVSEWMPNGNINEFIKANPEAERIELVGPPFPSRFPCLVTIGDAPACRRYRGVNLPP